MPEPRPSRLRQILQRPNARRRVGRAVASLMGAGLVALMAIGGLVIWHVIRRGRLIRERLGPPRDVPLPEFDRLSAPPPPIPEPRKSEPS